ncbi:MAG: glutaredoxin family protein [Actinomycetales bacterium]|nr:glutaredoxin family protein [Actinomycetales bacterium]
MTIRVYGADWCGDCRRTKAQLNALGVAYEYLDVEHDDELRDEAIAIAGRQSIPVVVLPDGSHLVEPSNPDLEARLRGLNVIA